MDLASVFGMVNAYNDIPVLNSSILFDDVIDGVAPGTLFYADDVEYENCYYPVDGV